MEPIAGTGSGRKYFRMRGTSHHLVGAWNGDRKENAAFIGFTRHFLEEGLPVPRVHAVTDDGLAYLLDDLGAITLFGFLASVRSAEDPFPQEAEMLYRKVIQWLPKFQVKGGKGLDYTLCYPRAAFDRQSILWDLNYFKYYFLKLAKIPFEEQLLEDDFQAFASQILKEEAVHFMYRDFQSRNIMVVDGEPVFIDYQGGRKGPLQYDIASLLYDAKAGIPEDRREMLLQTYLEEASALTGIDREEFRRQYDAVVLVRIFQALGAYGFRGYYENKPHFLQSIPYAMQNLKTIQEKGRIPDGLPMLTEVIRAMTERADLAFRGKQAGSLKVTVSSFSYRNGIPPDESGNGGGFVFDCRALPNPGREEAYRKLTGLDRPVVEFLRNEPSVDAFLNHAAALADQSVATYLDRGFTSLVVSFGCTGGQHRSVYCAEHLAAHLREKHGVEVICRHLEQEKKNTEA